MEQKRKKPWLVKSNKFNHNFHSPHQSNGFSISQMTPGSVDKHMDQLRNDNRADAYFINSKQEQEERMINMYYNQLQEQNTSGHLPLGGTLDKKRPKKNQTFLKEAEGIISSLIAKNNKKRPKPNKKIQSAVLNKGFEPQKLTLPKFTLLNEKDLNLRIENSFNSRTMNQKSYKSKMKKLDFDSLKLSMGKNKKIRAFERRNKNRQRVNKSKYVNIGKRLDLGNLMKIAKPNLKVIKMDNLHSSNFVKKKIHRGLSATQNNKNYELLSKNTYDFKRKVDFPKAPFKIEKMKKSISKKSKPIMKKNLDRKTSRSRSPGVGKKLNSYNNVLKENDRIIIERGKKEDEDEKSKSHKKLIKIASLVKLKEEKGINSHENFLESQEFQKEKIDIEKEIYNEKKDTPEVDDENKDKKVVRRRKKRRKKKKRKKKKRETSSPSSSRMRREKKPRPFTLRRKNTSTKNKSIKPEIFQMKKIRPDKSKNTDETSTTKSLSIQRDRSVSRKRSFMIKKGNNNLIVRSNQKKEKLSNKSFTANNSINLDKKTPKKMKPLSNSLFLEKKAKNIFIKKINGEGDLSTIKERIRPKLNPVKKIIKMRNDEDEEEEEKIHRKYKPNHILMNLIYLMNMEEIKDLKKVRFSMGKGNNHKLVERRLMDRQDLDTHTFWNSSNLVWTQTPSKRSNCTIYSKIYDRDMKKFKNRFKNIFGELDQETIKEKIQSAKIFRFTEEALLDELTSHLANLRKIPSIKQSNFQVTNHIKGSKYISRKQLLTKHVYALAKKRGIDPYSIIPKTYFIKEEDVKIDVKKMLKDIEKNYDFEDPWIIKPGEFSNRGSGIKMGYGKKEIKKFTLGLSEARKGAVILVQKYLSDPLLYKERKFDLRCYALAIKTRKSFSVYWYREGYARTSSFKYDCNAQDNLMVHLTNEAVQVKCNFLFFLIFSKGFFWKIRRWE